MNTTLESLAEGLPLVVLPIANDQPGIAARVAHLGIGKFIPVQKLTAVMLRQAVCRVLKPAISNGTCYPCGSVSVLVPIGPETPLALQGVPLDAPPIHGEGNPNLWLP